MCVRRGTWTTFVCVLFNIFIYVHIFPQSSYVSASSKSNTRDTTWIYGRWSLSLSLTSHILYSAGFYLRCICSSSFLEFHSTHFISAAAQQNYRGEKWEKKFNFAFPNSSFSSMNDDVQRKSISRCRFPFFYWPIKLCRMCFSYFFQFSCVIILTSLSTAMINDKTSLEGVWERF